MMEMEALSGETADDVVEVDPRLEDARLLEAVKQQPAGGSLGLGERHSGGRLRLRSLYTLT